MFDPALAKCLKAADFVAIATDADALAHGFSMVTQTSSTLWPYDVIAKDERFGPSIADGIFNALSVGGRAGAAQLYVGWGIDLSLPQTQAGLDQLASAAPSLASACAALKLLGVWEVTLFVSRGVTWSPTVNDITFHRAANVAAANWEQLANNTIPTLLSQGANWADIKTAINGVV